MLEVSDIGYFQVVHVEALQQLTYNQLICTFLSKSEVLEVFNVSCLEAVGLEEGLFPCHLPPPEASRGVKGHKVGGSVEEE